MPLGDDVMVPPAAPAPAFTTLSTYVCNVNVAVTVVALLSGRTHPPVPVQPPLHPVNVEPTAGAAVSVIAVPMLYDEVHADPQLIPVGTDVTAPVPLPASTTVSARVCM